MMTSRDRDWLKENQYMQNNGVMLTSQFGLLLSDMVS